MQGKGIGEDLLNRTDLFTRGGQAVKDLRDYKDTAIEIAAVSHKVQRTH